MLTLCFRFFWLYWCFVPIKDCSNRFIYFSQVNSTLAPSLLPCQLHPPTNRKLLPLSRSTHHRPTTRITKALTQPAILAVHPFHHSRLANTSLSRRLPRRATARMGRQPIIQGRMLHPCPSRKPIHNMIKWMRSIHPRTMPQVRRRQLRMQTILSMHHKCRKIPPPTTRPAVRPTTNSNRLIHILAPCLRVSNTHSLPKDMTCTTRGNSLIWVDTRSNKTCFTSPSQPYY